MLPSGVSAEFRSGGVTPASPVGSPRRWLLLPPRSELALPDAVVRIVRGSTVVFALFFACGSWDTPWVGTTDSDQGTAKQYHRLMAIFDNMPIGDSFKGGMVEKSENHREALWSKVALVGTYESLQRANPDKRGDAWDRRCRYATVRMAQALEFRSAAQSATLLTKPLLMYYSFLNLLRGVMAVDDDLALTKGHGLKYHSGPSLFDNAAVVNTGTFAEYLRACSVVAPSNFRLSLAACLAHIPELAGEVVSVGLKSQVAPVAVDALRSGHVSLCFNQAFNLRVRVQGWLGPESDGSTARLSAG